jgi:hypothetical protein
MPQTELQSITGKFSGDFISTPTGFVSNQSGLHHETWEGQRRNGTFG